MFVIIEFIFFLICRFYNLELTLLSSSIVGPLINFVSGIPHILSVTCSDLSWKECMLCQQYITWPGAAEDWHTRQQHHVIALMVGLSSLSNLY